MNMNGGSLNKPPHPVERPPVEQESLPPLSFTRAQLDDLIANEEHTPEEVMRLFDTDFADLLDIDAGVMERYTVREHSRMAVWQFMKYFSKTAFPDGVDRGFMEALLALHDIGKAEAMAEKSSLHQHEYTLPILRRALGSLNYTEKHIALASALADGDEIGSYLKRGERADPAKTAQNIAEAAKTSGYALSEFYPLLKIFYMSDAGSYTQNAGGKRNLDDLFIFNSQTGKMTFAPETQEYIDDLDSQVAELIEKEESEARGAAPKANL